MQVIVTASALYGCETWTLMPEVERKIQAFELRCLRRLLGVYALERPSEKAGKNVWEEGTGARCEPPAPRYSRTT